jgi:hypothetical protein
MPGGQALRDLQVIDDSHSLFALLQTRSAGQPKIVQSGRQILCLSTISRSKRGKKTIFAFNNITRITAIDLVLKVLKNLP